MKAIKFERAILIAFVASGAIAGACGACGNKQSSSGGQGGSAPGSQQPPTAPTNDTTAMIDTAIDAMWKQAGVTPAPDAGDAEYLRRVTLDLIGRIPTQQEVTDFLADKVATKRETLVDRLLASDDYAEHWGVLYADSLVGRGIRMSPKFPQSAAEWFERSFHDNKPLDAMAREIVTARGQMVDNGTVGYYAGNRFRGGSIESLAGNTARYFLGLQIQCAQCHDHPYDPRWKQQDFAEFAAFWAETQLKRQDKKDANTTYMDDVPLGFQARPNAKIAIRRIAPRFLGKDVAPQQNELRRDALARLMTASPLFARAAVGRTWDRLFGRGILDPWDDLGAEDDPKQPPLLVQLGDQFASHGYDHRWLLRVIVLSKAYGRSSTGGVAPKGATTGALEAVFARAAVRPLTADQLFRSQLLATGIENAAAQHMPQWKIERRKLIELRQYLFAFEDDEGQESDAFTGSIPQALLLRNGDLTNSGTKDVQGLVIDDILTTVADPGKRIDRMFVAAYGRLPDADERKHYVDYVGAHAGNAAYEDLFHALLTSTEFITNH